MKSIFVIAAMLIIGNASAEMTTIVIDQPKGSVQICNVICDETGKFCRVVCS